MIHIEPPWGDDGRNSTTPFLGSEGVLYTVSNRSKRGIVLDIRNPKGHDLLLKMVEDADVFIENMRIGVLDKRGLGLRGPLEAEPRPRLHLESAAGAARGRSSSSPPTT